MDDIIHSRDAGTRIAVEEGAQGMAEERQRTPPHNAEPGMYFEIERGD